jgi:hypothetical protein
VYIFIKILKAVIFFLAMASFGFGILPEYEGATHGGFAFASLSIALMVVWAEVKSTILSFKK